MAEAQQTRRAEADLEQEAALLSDWEEVLKKRERDLHWREKMVHDHERDLEE